MNAYTLYVLQPKPDVARNAPPAKATTPTLTVQASDAVKLWVELKRAYVGLRGSVEGRNHKAIPKTTNHDVLQLATRWSTELIKSGGPRNDHDRSDHAAWKACVEEVHRTADRAHLNAEYPLNEKFWQKCTARLAIYLESRKVVPGKWSIAAESLKEAIFDLPDTIGSATRATAQAAGSAAKSILREPAKFAAVLLGGAILLPPIIRAFRK